MATNLPNDIRQAIATESKGLGASSGVGLFADKAFRYGDPKVVEEHIQNIMHSNGSDRVIHGIKNLIQAAEVQGSKPFLRQGQIIFGTATVARALSYPPCGFLFNCIAPLILKVATGEARKFAYMHVAVYAGQVDGKHYVIHNGGNSWDNLGMISAEPIKKAFDKEALFFVLSPPKDSKGNSTRYLVLQRALACLGTFFDYDIRAVSCEVFAMTMLELKPTFDPIQVQALKPLKEFW